MNESVKSRRSPRKRQSPCSVPSPNNKSPAKSVKSERSLRERQSPSLPSPQNARSPRDANNSKLVNYGSEEDSDSDDDEVGMAPVPRVFRAMLDTLLDCDDAAGETDTNTEPAAATVEPTEGTATPGTTLQPSALFQFDWSNFPETMESPTNRREAFTQINVGPQITNTDPYEIFLEIWDRPIVAHIVQQTNKYAQQVVAKLILNHKLHPSSRICQWQDTTIDEIYIYFGLILAMGVVVKSRIDEYWSSVPDIFYTPGFGAHMSIDRFLLLSKCIHFNDNNDMCALNLDYVEARLFKIMPIVSHLNQKFQTLYTPAQNLALDESLLMWKGRLEFSQLIPNKKAKRGIKSYELCESQTGYLWRFEIHAHKKKSPQQVVDPCPLAAPTPAVVLRLVEGLEHKGYTLWMDSYYQSPSLARHLKSVGFDCAGTLRTDRKFVPRVLHSLTSRDMSPGQIVGLTSGDVDVMVWRDNNRVATISTYHGNGQQTVRGSTKPILILDYNIMMGGVDKKDQLLAMYPVERKRTRVWYKKLFRRLLNVSVLNAFIIHHHSCTLSHRDFRLNLIKSLLSFHCTPAPIPRASTPCKVDVSHRLSEFPMRTHQRMRRSCTLCKKLVRTFCVGCDKTVCMEPCFEKIHTMIS